MNYVIRKTKLDEMTSVEDAHRRSIQQICSKDYSPEQIKYYSDVKYTEYRWKQSIENDLHLSVEFQGRIEGMCHAKVRENQTGCLEGLYFTPVVAGHGVGREVFELALTYFRDHDVKRIYLTGTITARGFYEKMGFKAVSYTHLTLPTTPYV